MADMSCPPPDQIRQFLSGQLELDEIEAVSAHLERCPSCDETTARLESECTVNLSPDAEGVEFEDEPALQATLQKIKQDPASGEVASAPTLNPGDRLGAFQINQLVGRGGMGEVYSAQHEHLQRQVALKVIPAAAQQGVASRERFLREMRINGQLTHPNIVQTFDAGESNESLYLAMEFLEGNDLGELLKWNGSLPLGAACEAVRQAALGVEHAHQAGVIHRDLKPSNLFVTRAGEVKVLDLGLARLAGEANQEELTRAGQFVGTVDYMSPEQIDSSRRLDHRTDIYSLGATLLKLLAGSAPYVGEQYDSLVRKLQAIASPDDIEIRSRLKDVPPALVELLEQMLQKDADKRPSSATKVAERLAPFAQSDALRQFACEDSSDSPSPATVAVASEPATTHRQKSRSLMYALLAVGAIALAVPFVIPSADNDAPQQNEQRAEQLHNSEDSNSSDQTIALSVSDLDPDAQAETGNEPPKNSDPSTAGDRQEKTDRAGKPETTAEAGAKAQAFAQPIPLAVLEFRDFTELDAAAGLTNHVNARLMESDQLYLVERQELERVIEEQSLNLSGVVGTQQQIQIGKLTGARLMLTGTLTQLDETLLLSTKLFSTETGQVKGVSVKGKTSDDLADLADELAEKVLELVKTQAANLVPSSEPPADRLAELKKLLADRDKRSLSVHITERHIGQPTIDPAAETEFSKLALACEFSLVDSAAKPKTNPELIVRGEAFSELAGRRGDLVIVRARVEIEVLERKTGKILAKDRETAVHVGTAEHVAGKTALQKAAGLLAERILPVLAPADAE